MIVTLIVAGLIALGILGIWIETVRLVCGLWNAMGRREQQHRR